MLAQQQAVQKIEGLLHKQSPKQRQHCICGGNWGGLAVLLC